MSKSSLEGRQLATDVVEHSEAVQDIGIPSSQMPQPLSVVTADEANRGTSSYFPQPEEIICNSNMASDVEEREVGVAPAEVRRFLDHNFTSSALLSLVNKSLVVSRDSKYLSC